MLTPAQELLKYRHIPSIHKGLQHGTVAELSAMVEGTAVIGGALHLPPDLAGDAHTLPYRQYAVCHMLARLRSPLLEAITALSLPFTRPESAAMDLGFLSQFPNLHTLTLHHIAHTAALPSLPGLTHLTLFATSGLRIASLINKQLQHLHLEDITLSPDDNAAIRSVQALQTLHLERCTGVEVLPALTDLRTLCLRQCGPLEHSMSVPDSGRFPTPNESTPSTAPHLSALIVPDEDLSFPILAPQLTDVHCKTERDLLRFAPHHTVTTLAITAWSSSTMANIATLPNLQCLRLHATATLTSLHALSHCPRLHTLVIQDCDDLEDLTPLSTLTNLRSLTLDTCPSLETLHGLNGSQSLQNLTVRHCPKLENLDGLTAINPLQQLQLEHCPALKSAMGIRDLPNLHHVVLPHSVGLGQRTFQLQDIPVLQHHLQQQHWRQQVMDVSHPHVPAIRTMLTHDAHMNRQQAAELLMSVDTALVDAVLGATTVAENGEIETWIGESSDALLVALAHSSLCPQPLQRLVLRGRKHTSLAPLRHFPALTSLVLDGCWMRDSLDGLQHCPDLQHLTVSGKRPFDLSALKHCPNLRTLTLGARSTSKELMSLNGLHQLERLDVTGADALPLAVLAALPQLRELRVSGFFPPMGLVGDHLPEHLEVLEIHQPDALTSLTAVTTLSSLHTLVLGESEAVTALDSLSALPNLQHLILGGPNLQDTAALRSLTGLKTLGLLNCTAATDLSFLEALNKIETLHLDGLSTSNLQMLHALPRLTRLTLQNLCKLHSLDDLEGCAGLQRLIVVGHFERLESIDALLDLPTLSHVLLRQGDPHDSWSHYRPWHRVKQWDELDVLRAKLRKDLTHRQDVTRRRLRAALYQQDADALEQELTDLETFADPRLVRPLLRHIATSPTGQSSGDLFDGIPQDVVAQTVDRILRCGEALKMPEAITLARQRARFQTPKNGKGPA